MQTDARRSLVMICFCLGLASGSTLPLSIAGPAAAADAPPSAAVRAKGAAVQVAEAIDGGTADTNSSAASIIVSRIPEKGTPKGLGRKTNVKRVEDMKYKREHHGVDGKLEKRNKVLVEAPVKEEEEDFRRMRRETEAKTSSEQKDEKLKEEQMNEKRSSAEKDVENNEEMKAEANRDVQDLAKNLKGKLLEKKVRRGFEYSPILEDVEEEEEKEQAKVRRGSDLKLTPDKAVKNEELKRAKKEENEEADMEEEAEEEQQLLEEMKRKREDDFNAHVKRRSHQNRLSRRQSDVDEDRSRRFAYDDSHDFRGRRYSADEDFLKRYYRDDDDDDGNKEDYRQRRYYVDDDSYYRIGRNPQRRHYTNDYRDTRYAHGGNEDRTRFLRYEDDEENEDDMTRAIRNADDDAYNDYLARAMRLADDDGYENAARVLRYADEDKDIIARGMRYSGDDNKDLLARSMRYAGDDAKRILARNRHYAVDDGKDIVARRYAFDDDKDILTRRHADDESKDIVARNMRYADDDVLARNMRYSADDGKDILARRYAIDDNKDITGQGMRSASDASKEAVARIVRNQNSDAKDYLARSMRYTGDESEEELSQRLRHSADDAKEKVSRDAFTSDEIGEDIGFARGLRRAADDVREKTSRDMRHASDDSKDELARAMRRVKDDSRSDLARAMRHAKEDSRDDLVRDMRYANDESRADFPRDTGHTTHNVRGEQGRDMSNAADEDNMKRRIRYLGDDRKARGSESSTTSSVSTSSAASEAARKIRYSDDGEEKGAFQETNERQRRIFGILDDYIPGWKRSLGDETGAAKADVISRKKRFVPAFNQFGHRTHAIAYGPVSPTGKKVLNDADRVALSELRADAQKGQSKQRRSSIMNRRKRRPEGQIRRSAKANKKQKAAARGRMK